MNRSEETNHNEFKIWRRDDSVPRYRGKLVFQSHESQSQSPWAKRRDVPEFRHHSPDEFIVKFFFFFFPERTSFRLQIRELLNYELMDAHRASMRRTAVLLLICDAFVGFAYAQNSQALQVEHRGDNCYCMEYWSCIISGGKPYSYCGLSESSVCCLLSSAEIKDGQVSTVKSKPKCGLKGYDSGRDGFADPSEWPWHVAIVEEPGFFYVCGGTLIDEYWALTAAHCVDEYYRNDTFKLKVRLGEYDVTKTTESLRHEDRVVDAIVIHPKYDNETLLHDVALLKLQLPAKQRPHIDVVCLPKFGDAFPSNSRCVITGWGKTSEDSRYSDILKEILVPLWDRARCEQSLRREFGPQYNLPDSLICAGSQGRDACDGDGGGPLVCQKDGQWHQVGIISYGIGCGQKNAPGVYTLVSYYEKWIRETVLFSKIVI